MKFLVDQQLPPLLAMWLRDTGFEASHVRELGLKDAPDTAIWAKARAENWLVITKDEDFVKLWRDQEQGGVLWVRFGNCSNAAVGLALSIPRGRTWRRDFASETVFSKSSL